ncbi:MFS transporter [Piscinibacter terrae]|uniref:MFS transporter n=1 Tax=Piscinibacter terrae TaxID=2496871 RepID=A0A3N7JRV1_9BURK|nr:MFS transporter [Albitalea terrae]RQP21755.1 MFS transporter [Albitalea terrae]
MSSSSRSGAIDDTPALRPVDGLRYGALGLPLAFLAIPLYLQLPSHYAAHEGVSLPALGLVLLLTRLADALVDPFIGLAADRWFSRSSRMAWRIAAASAIAVAAGFPALFFPPSGVPPLAWLAVMLLLTYLAFSVLVVVHQAWGVRLGGNTARRARVVGWREGFGLVGVIAASVLPSVAGMATSAVVLAVSLAVGLGLLSKAPSPDSPQAAVTHSWLLPWRHAAFRRLLAVFMLNGIASAVPSTLVLFFIRDRLQLPRAEPLFLSAYFLSAVCSLPLWTRAAGRFGLARTWWAGMLLAIASFTWTWLLGAGHLLGFALVCVASGIALGADLTAPGALLTGVVQRSRQDATAQGVYVGWWNTATKLNLGLAAGLALPLLSWAGYTPGRHDNAALTALGIGYVLVPCSLKLLAAGLLWRRWLQPEDTA